MARVKCTCRCHEPGSKMRHIQPCCDDGWVEISDQIQKPQEKLSTDRGMIELLGIAYRHDDGSLTVVPFDDPYLGDLGRQSLLMIHQHICTEVERMQKTPPPPPPKIMTTDPLQEPMIYSEGHIRCNFWRDSTGEHEAYEIGNLQGIFTRKQITDYVRSGGPVLRLTMNGQDQPPDAVGKFVRVLRGQEYPDGAKPFMGDEFKPSKN